MIIIPYIKKQDKTRWEELLNHIDGEFEFQLPSSGELNYIIISMIHNYIMRVGLKYHNLNEVIGVLEGVKLELYRMVVAKYENKKRLTNGGVSELDAKNLEDVR